LYTWRTLKIKVLAARITKGHHRKVLSIALLFPCRACFQLNQF
jgi:hypothetical protein